jgi:hypothetical protein
MRVAVWYILLGFRSSVMFHFRNAKHASSTLRRSLDHKVQVKQNQETEEKCPM